jgi:hypothetical protein
MAAGDHHATADLLRTLEGTGVSGMNITYLGIKRLARLGHHAELLRSPSLPDVVNTRPPLPVREAILDAIYSTMIATALADGDLDRAKDAVTEGGQLVPALADGPLTELSAEALSVVAVAAVATNDSALWGRLRSDEEAWRRLTDSPMHAILLAGQAEIPEATEPVGDPAALVEPAELGVAQPESWPDLLAAVARSADVRAVIAEESWRSWPPPATADSCLAERLNGLDDDAAERAWEVVGAFVDSDGYRQPASLTASAFLVNAFTYNRFRSDDLAGVAALLEIALRGGLAADDYRSLLDDLRAECDRWVSLNQATSVLDICDNVARAPCPDQEARLRLMHSLLLPLSLQSGRLEVDQLELARIIDRELRLDLVWARPGDGSPDQPTVTHKARDVLLYSLDETVLARVSTALSALSLGLRVRVSSDQVGGPQLKQWVNRADIVVMATRCATHAATGFIRSNARAGAIIREADGSGSASLLRAVSAVL